MASKLSNKRAKTQALLRRLGEIDWDFPTQMSESAFSAVHWHPCRFPSQIPAVAIGRMTEPGDMVLDPFMGSATTLVEAQRLGRRSFGIDINPVSCLIARAKTLSVSQKEIDAAFNTIRQWVHGSWEKLAEASPPTSVQTTKWYMPSTLSDLTRLHALRKMTVGVSALFSEACFSSILLAACREERHWGYVCDNTRPLGNRAPDARRLFSVTLERLATAYSERLNSLHYTLGDASIVNGDAATALSSLGCESVDLVVTSPPYFGVADYVKAQRLTLEWDGIAIEPMRLLEIGARSKRHRLNALEVYISELDLAFREVYRVMQKGAMALIVFGQSPSRADAHVHFVENLRAAGFFLHLQRLRNISIGRRQMPSVVQEYILLVSK